MTTDTLYETLARLLEQGLIERALLDGGPAPGKPRKTYCLAHLGRQVIQAEAARLALLTAAARSFLRQQ